MVRTKFLELIIGTLLHMRSPVSDIGAAGDVSGADIFRGASGLAAGAGDSGAKRNAAPEALRLQRPGPVRSTAALPRFDRSTGVGGYVRTASISARPFVAKERLSAPAN
ncbi:hypothetical protein D3C71_1176600 [compost metagenome]